MLDPFKSHKTSRAFFIALGLMGLGLAIPTILLPKLKGFGSMGGIKSVNSANANATKVGSLDKVSPTFMTCSAVRERSRDFLKLHYSVRKYDEEISRRTFQKFFQILDPGKNFFWESDLARFAEYETQLGKKILQTDCQFITEVAQLFMQRVVESESLRSNVLASEPNFSLDERIETDRKKIMWAQNPQELQERWRTLLKFNAMSMIETDNNWPKTQQRLQKRYAQMQKTMTARSIDEIFGIFLNAFALSLDPHSSYYMPEEQDDFKVAFSLQLVGIGASLSQQDGYTVVESLIAGGSAVKDGRLQKGDKIIGVDSGDGAGVTDVVDMDLNKVVSLIRGKKDTTVQLQVLRKDSNGQTSRILIDLKRNIVQLADQQAHSDVMTLAGKKVGVINLPSFYIDYAGSRNQEDFRSSAGDVLREVEALKKQNVDGILIDLRRNGGGDLGECIKITGQFIDRGSVVQVQGRGGDVESLDDKDEGVAFAGPLAVLISKQSASASEIFAGAMQDYGRALILGDSRTYGKATVQNVIEVPGTNGRESDGSVKVTVSKFFRPSGRSNQERGVPSDIQIPDIFEAADISEGENDFVLPYTTISPHKGFHPFQDFSKIMASLRENSKQRVQSLPEFKKVFEATEKLLKEKSNTTLSLKIEKLKPTPTAAVAQGVTAAIGPVVEDLSKVKVIAPNDIQLKEGAAILVDSINLLGSQTKWVNP